MPAIGLTGHFSVPSRRRNRRQSRVNGLLATATKTCLTAQISYSNRPGTQRRGVRGDGSIPLLITSGKDQRIFLARESITTAG